MFNIVQSSTQLSGRENESCYVGNPVGLIQGIAGPLGDHCYNFFEFYRLNHSEFLNEMQADFAKRIVLK